MFIYIYKLNNKHIYMRPWLKLIDPPTSIKMDASSRGNQKSRTSACDFPTGDWILELVFPGDLLRFEVGHIIPQGWPGIGNLLPG